MDEIRILDHGYLAFVESWGSDESIVTAARMSTGKGFLGWGGDPCPQCYEAHRLDERDKLFRDASAKKEAEESCICKGLGKTVGDEKLLAYLYGHKHTSPFEMGGMVVEVMAPIMVFREWHRHRTQSYNEMSARYTPLPDVNYIPTIERLFLNSKTNKQAGTVKGAEILTEESARSFQDGLRLIYQQQEALYQTALMNGIPKELARIHLPVGRYSRMRASANLKNWLGFLTLRMDLDAQWEIRQYANAICGLLREHFPRTLQLFLPV